MNSNSLQKKIKNSAQSFSLAGNNVYCDWSIILGLFCIVALVMVGVSAGLFFSINTDDDTTGQSATTVAVRGPSSNILDTTDLTNLISIFQSKNAQMSVFTVTYSGPSDPAVPMKFTATSTKSLEASSTATSIKKVPAK